MRHSLTLLFLILIPFCTIAQEKEESSYSLLSSKFDKDLSPGQSSFLIHFSNEKGPITTEILMVDNGVEKHLLPDEKGNLVYITKPGKHALMIVYEDNYFPIRTDALITLESFQIRMDVKFKSSVLITFKDK